MKKIFVLFMIIASISVFAQDKPAPVLALSGNVYTGIQADFSKGSGSVYAYEDANATPIWANFRADYSFDGNAGMTLNFRTKGTDAVSSTSSRFYPFLNRGFVWAKTSDNMLKVRSGYLWDSDFESSNNAWDTASNYEWVTELTANPVKGLELGATLPTPYNKMDAMDAIKDITYGFVYSPSFGRISVMGEIGHIDANRAVNFGIDFTAVKNMLLRVEGDLQQIGIADVGYYQLFQQANYVFGNITPDIQVTEVFSKVAGVDPNYKFVPNITAMVNGITLYGQLIYSFTNIVKPYYQSKVSAQFPINAKANIKPYVYVTKADSANMVFTPGIQFFASF